MTKRRPAPFRGRHFEDVIILLCVRWYLRYSLTYRDLEEMMTERNLSVDHVTIWRWVQHYAPVLNQRICREMRHPNRSWRVDETYIKVAGNWAYLYRAADSAGETIEFMLSPKRDLIATKLFLRLALYGAGPRPRVINVLNAHQSALVLRTLVVFSAPASPIFADQCSATDGPDIATLGESSRALQC